MNPRLTQSKKWTSLPDEYLEQIESVFSENFKEQIKSGKIIAEGRVYPTELLLRVGFLENGRLKQANFEISIEYNQKKDNMVKMVYIAIDCAASMMAQYFESDGQAEFPLDWQIFEVEKREVYLRHSTVNSDLESEADRLLGDAEDETLVQGEDVEEEKQGVINMLGLGEQKTDDDDSDK